MSITFVLRRVKGCNTYMYCSFVRSILEYAREVLHFSLTAKLSYQIEKIQKRAVKIFLPLQTWYETSLCKLNLITLAERRQELCYKLYQSIGQDENNKLNELLPEP
jgi:hypothetical protein